MITLQARAANGTWATRNAFTDQNKLVSCGQMARDALIALATDTQRRWNATHDDAGVMRVHDDALGAPKSAETLARAAGWVVRPATVSADGVPYDPCVVRGTTRADPEYSFGFKYAETFEDACAADALTS